MKSPCSTMQDFLETGSALLLEGRAHDTRPASSSGHSSRDSYPLQCRNERAINWHAAEGECADISASAEPRLGNCTHPCSFGNPADGRVESCQRPWIRMSSKETMSAPVRGEHVLHPVKIVDGVVRDQKRGQLLFRSAPILECPKSIRSAWMISPGMPYL